MVPATLAKLLDGFASAAAEELLGECDARVRATVTGVKASLAAAQWARVTALVSEVGVVPIC